MIVTVASFKGGVGKTTTAVHLAAFLSENRSSTVLIDGDDNSSATAWGKRGSLPFPVVDARQTARVARQFENLVIDTPARPSLEDLRQLVDGCDMLIIPSTPDALSLDALQLTVEALRNLQADRFRVLLTVIPPKPSRDGDEARAMLTEEKLPLFAGSIRRLAAFQKAALAGHLVKDVDDSRAHLGWEDYQAVGKELLNGKV